MLTDPVRDPELARAIRAADGPPPGRARLELLRVRIAAATAVAIESRRERAWWEWMTRWGRAEVALAAAATIIAAGVGNMSAVGRAALGDEVAPTTASVAHRPVGAAQMDSVVRHALAAGVSSEQVMNAVVGPVSGDWLLAAAVSRPNSDR